MITKLFPRRLVIHDILFHKYSTHLKSILDIIPTFSITPDLNNKEISLNNDKYSNYLPVTYILSKTSSPESLFALNRWRKNKIKQLGEAGFDNYMNEVTTIGSRAHCILDEYIINKENPTHLPNEIKGYFDSAQEFLFDAKSAGIEEKHVLHKSLFYKGIVDSILMISNNKEILEIKTKYENRRVSSLKDAYDDPIQLAAYIGAYNADKDKIDQITRGRLLYVYKDGYLSTDFLIKDERLEMYWQLWKERLLKYYTEHFNQ